ncbi:polyketide synthase [Penicillium brasilianum]|uniref:Polyketide synthase n=1 Tax=Penicillium brasilianum TaxID=104259 RepID=A0A1S9RMU1_PENBI|nr:polyketide synthase [Penicillium brasilianum]
MGSLGDLPLNRISVLFGSKYSEIDRSALHIRRYLSTHRAATWLEDAVEDLPSVWQDVTNVWPAGEGIHGEAELQQLSAFLRGEELPLNMEDPMNYLLMPITVLRHLVDFHEFKEAGSDCDIKSMQGFCAGYLAAVAGCWEKDQSEFSKVVATMVRTAIFIGAAVDLDELATQRATSIAVRWKIAEAYKLFAATLGRYPGAYIACITDESSVTVTVWEDQAAALVQELEGNGLLVKDTRLRGRFHHADHLSAAQDILKLCQQDTRFQLPNTCPARELPRSNADGDLPTLKSLLSVAIQSILISQTDWNLTVSNTLNSLDSSDAKCILSIGAGQFLPRQARSQILNTIDSSRGDNLVNGDHDNIAITNGTSFAASSVNGMAPVPTSIPIAVTGLACRYPQADCVEELWKILEQGLCTVSRMPESRLKPDRLQRKPDGPFWGNFISRPDAFDHRFFKISAREAESMDPQQRLLLQVAYEAMESAGYCGLRATNLPEDVGCYVGVGTEDYSENVGSRNATAFSATGTLQAFNSGRVSHHFGWTGPSVTVDTACSSAAVAIHLACQALQTSDCSVAVAGGVNVMTDPRWSQNLAAASFLSPTGASKAFDTNANGYCRGEGAGLVVLRPLEAALRDGDPIYAVITGTSVNQGANCSPITVPDSNSQRSLYMKALSLSGLKPEVVSYVEAHGTGTQVGDPIEFESIRKTFAVPSRTERLYVGSIKDNIGHTETSSGVAGLLKTILMLQKGKIPKQANFTQLNPKIIVNQEDQMSIPTSLIRWKTQKRVAMVTNYGAAGSNAAIVLKEPIPTPTALCSDEKERLLSAVPFFVAAQTEESLREYCQALKARLLNGAHLESIAVQDLAFNLARKQNRSMEFSVSFTNSSSVTELHERLDDVISGRMNIVKKTHTFNPVVLCFGGQTGNKASISESLVASSALIRLHLDECESACKALGLPSLFPAIFDSSPNKDIVNLHCVLFSIQYATAKAWIDSGLEVDRMIGHSFGQLTAVCVAGGLSLIDTMRLISTRAHLIRSEWTSEIGVMLSLKGEKNAVRDLLDSVPDSADLACVNGADSFVAAGSEVAIHEIEKNAAERGIKSQRLDNTHAFHSRLVDPILPGLAKVASSLNYKPLRIPVEACSESEEDWMLPTWEKIVQHSRKPVYFHQAIHRTISRIHGPAIWLEAGTMSPIIGMVRRAVDNPSSARGHVFCPMDLSGPQAESNLAKVTSSLWSNGVAVQFWPFHGSQRGYQWINLPPYQFAKTSHWIEYDPTAFFYQKSKQEEPPTEDLKIVQLLKNEGKVSLFRINDNDPMFRMCTAGHAVVEQNLCPASLYFELVVRAAITTLPKGTDPTMYHLADLNISAPLVLDMPGSVLLELTQRDSTPGQWTFVLFTREDTLQSVTHATGTISLSPGADNTGISSRFSSLKRLLNPVHWDSIATSPSSSGLKRSTVYQAFRRAVTYAEYYRGVESVYALGHEATGRVYLPSSPTKNSPCDPILIDNFLQVAGIHVNCLSETHDDEVFVCSSVGDVIIGESFVKRDPSVAAPWVVYSNYEQESKKKALCDVFVVDEATGSLALCVLAATFTSVSIQSLRRTLTRLTNKGVSPVPRDIAVAAEVTPAVPAASSITATRASSNGDDLRTVQAMLSELLGIPTSEIPASASLADVGVDSLMNTEVLSEIKNRFQVVITKSELTAIEDVGALVQRIFPGRSTVHIENHDQPAVGITAINGGSKPSSGGSVPASRSGDDLSGFADKAGELFTASRKSNEHSEATQFLGFCDTVFPQQMELVTAYVVEAFKVLGVDLQSLKAGQPIPSVDILPQHGQVMNQLYAVLEYSGLVERSGTSICRGHCEVNQDATAVLHQRILNDHPQHTSEHKLLHTTGPRLADCLTGAADPLSLLFQDAQARALMQDVYSNAPMFKSATMHLAQYLKNLLRQVNSPRPIKILEIGAGTGGTTDYLLKQLSSVAGLRFEYTFTDISPSLVTLARKRFKTFNFIHYQTLDIEKGPASEMLGQYDIIVSSNCIHATRSLSTSCSNIQKLLRPHGILCLIELTRNLFWFDLVFGLLEGWWLFNDGRSHALAHESFWDQTLRSSGFNWVDWTDNQSEESKILRLIVASPTRPALSLEATTESSDIHEETVVYGRKDGLDLLADIHYPQILDSEGKNRPVALLIHGGGHIMLSRKDVRPTQVQLLIDMGFLPVSIDYRLCPEVSLLEGPMADVCEALAWAQNTLPQLNLQRPDIRPDGNKVVAVGWSSGGHLAMTLAWTAPARGLRAPEAVLSFYCATDYTDPFWTKPNFPYQGDVSIEDVPTQSPFLGINDRAITSYNPAPRKRALGGWMSPTDPRSRIALHMNWTGQTLTVLFNGHKYKSLVAIAGGDDNVILPKPTLSEIQKACPLSHVYAGQYKTPTFIIHGTLDDLIPVEQSQRTHDQMLANGVESELRVVADAPHLFDMSPNLKNNKDACRAVADGYEFLRSHVGL